MMIYLATAVVFALVLAASAAMIIVFLKSYGSPPTHLFFAATTTIFSLFYSSIVVTGVVLITSTHPATHDWIMNRFVWLMILMFMGEICGTAWFFRRLYLPQHFHVLA